MTEYVLTPFTLSSIGGYAELSLAKQANNKNSGKCEKTQAEKEFLAILEKNLFLEQSHEDWASGIEANPFTLDDLEVEFSDYAGIKEEETRLSSLDPLSKVLKINPTTFKSNRLSAVNRQVSTIDKLPDKCKTTQVLLLSNNYIKDLTGLQQFKQLKTLSLSNNAIISFEALKTASRACTLLESANFEGNRICKYPFYRSHLVSLFPALNVLDNCPVSDKERKLAKRDVLVTTEHLSEIVQNYCLISFLKHVVDLLKIHVGIRLKSGGSNTSMPVTRASIKLLISSWRKENHFGEDILVDIKLHYCVELSKVKHQIQYFCKKAGIKQDKSTLWMKAFEKVLGHQEAIIKELSSQVEQFTPVDVRASPLDASAISQGQDVTVEGVGTNKRNSTGADTERASSEEALSKSSLFFGRKVSRGSRVDVDGEAEPIARSVVPTKPITGRQTGQVEHQRRVEDTQVQDRQRTRLRFRPIERSPPSARGRGPESEDSDSSVRPCGPSTSPYLSSAEGNLGISTKTLVERDEIASATVSTSCRKNRKEHTSWAADETATDGSRPVAKENVALTSLLGRGETSADKSKSKVFFQDITATDTSLVMSDMDEAEVPPQGASMVEELRETIERLDEEATSAVESVERAIGDLNEDLDNVIFAQQNLQQKIVHTKLMENETRNLLQLEKKQNEKLKESTGAIDKLIEENNNLKFEVASLKQEYQSILGQLRREKQKVESLEKEAKAHKEADEEREGKIVFSNKCESLARRSLLRRVFLHYIESLQTMRWQKDCFLQIQHTYQRRVKREVLLWWHALHNHMCKVKQYKAERRDKRVRSMLKYWRKWAETHREKRLMILDLYERADQITKRKVLHQWKVVAEMTVESQDKIAYTFQQFWIRKKTFTALSNIVSLKRAKNHLTALANYHRMKTLFHSWCRWHVAEVDEQGQMKEAEEFSRLWLMRRMFNRFLLLVVLNERRHIAKLIAVNHYVKRLQFSTIRVWRNAVTYEHKKGMASTYVKRRLVWASFQRWKKYWDTQVTKKVRRKKMGVIGKIISNERNAQMRASAFFKWYAYTKRVNAETLEDQLLEQEQKHLIEKEQERRSSISLANRRESNFGIYNRQRRTSQYHQMDLGSSRYNPEMVLEKPLVQEVSPESFVSRRSSIREEPLLKRRESAWHSAGASPYSSEYLQQTHVPSFSPQPIPSAVPTEVEPTAAVVKPVGSISSTKEAPTPVQQMHVRELMDLHNEINVLQSRILDTLGN